MHRPPETSLCSNPVPRRLRNGALPFALRRRWIPAALLIAALHAIPAHSQEGASPGAETAPPLVDSDAGPVIPQNDVDRSRETTIEGDRFEMIANENELHFFVTGNVIVTGNNITLTCDRIEGISSRTEDEMRTGDRLGGMGRIRSMVAIGNVHVRQEGREALAGRAEVLPDEGRVILTESPVIRDAQGQVSGERIILYQGLERAVVESGPGRPARVVLPTLPDLGFPGDSQRQQEGQEDSE